MYRILLTVAFSLSCLMPAWASDRDFTGCEWVPGRLVVDFVPEVGTLQDLATADGTPVKIGVPTVDALLEQYRISTMYRIADDKVLSKLKYAPDFYRYVVLQGPEDLDVLQMMRDFDANEYVAAADPDLLHHAYDTEPNDPLWGSQWDKRCMGAPRAWDYSTGSEELIVVAIDGGTCWDHPDFYDNLWVNPGEDLDGDGASWSEDWSFFPGDIDDQNGNDDDGNGKVDDLIGWDFVRNINGCVTGEDCDSFEDNDPIAVGDHGTHVLGLMGAQGNNNLGCTGVCWDVRVMTSRSGYTRASDGQGLVVSSAAVACILWAVAHGADVLNMSYGSASGGGPEGTAITTAWQNGAICVGAAGNETSSALHYPAAFPEVIAVGSTDNISDCNQVSDFSNYGSWVECFAPGGGVMSTLCPNQNPGYGNEQGTSMASPNTAGCVALLWSIFPSFTNQQIKDLLLAGCIDISEDNPGFAPADLGYGRVNLEQSLQTLLPYLTVDSTWITNDSDNDGRLEAGESCSFYMDVHNETGWSSGQNIQVSVTSEEGYLTVIGGEFTLGNIQPGQTVSSASSPVLIEASSALPRPLWATLNVTFTGNGGNLNLTREVLLRVGRPSILLVDDDNGQFYSDFYSSAMLSEPAAEYDHDVWDRRTDDPSMNHADFHEYDHIVWICGNESSNTLTAEDMTALAAFMDAGGNAFVVGQGIDHDAAVTGNSFYADYLRSASAGTAGSTQLTGVAGDPISADRPLALVGGGCGGNGNVSPSVVTTANGGIGFYTYNSNSGVGAVRYDGSYKSAYFAFALEAACGLVGSVHHTVIIRSILEWFGATTEDAEPVAAAIPSGFSLRANYPNPFNPSTTISFDVPHRTRVTLRVFDVLGRQVATLVNRNLDAGAHEIAFDGSDLASGVYLVNMQADNFSQTRRMVLMK